ncbi:CU044_2847 family protein [Streptomyces sp. GS7]|uniref:CU044_2847 family protein n=1 Tax=Streptomyces sp. GS7 TaxID=2692234 RepID=UPI0013181AB3|nr:CU044_2847 family protein [Streptomyces sp. GS7]QHC25476.1 hypothetical protein GR130_32940 [Streptomyces sp. GS7]
MPERAQRIELPDGTEVWARVSRLVAAGLDEPDDAGWDGEFEDVGAWDALGARVEGLREVIGGVAASVREATEWVAPHETSVTFGVEVSAKPGKAVALLAEDLRAQRRGQEAAKLEQEAISQLAETLGAEHPHTLSARRRRRPYWDFEPQPV